MQAKLGRVRHQLLVFLDRPGEVEVTNSGCERLLRPVVVKRNVISSYRATWVTTGEADIRTVVDTVRLTSASPFAIILKTAGA